MRNWYDIEFTPNHVTCKFKRYFATDLLIDGKSVEQIKAESYNKGFDDALLYLQSHVDDLKNRPRRGYC